MWYWIVVGFEIWKVIVVKITLYFCTHHISITYVRTYVRTCVWMYIHTYTIMWTCLWKSTLWVPIVHSVTEISFAVVYVCTYIRMSRFYLDAFAACDFQTMRTPAKLKPYHDHRLYVPVDGKVQLWRINNPFWFVEILCWYVRTYVCTYLCLDVHTYVYNHVNVPVEVNLVSTNSAFCDWNFFCRCIRMYIHSHVKVLFGCFCCLWLSNNAHTSKAKALSWPQTVCACGWESAAVKNKQSLLICWITVLICTYVRTYVPTYVHAYVRMCVCY
jgi:hypothetical protein